MRVIHPNGMRQWLPVHGNMHGLRIKAVVFLKEDVELLRNRSDAEIRAFLWALSSTFVKDEAAPFPNLTTLNPDH